MSWRSMASSAAVHTFFLHPSPPLLHPPLPGSGESPDESASDAALDPKPVRGVGWRWASEGAIPRTVPSPGGDIRLIDAVADTLNDARISASVPIFLTVPSKVRCVCG
tara:strand:+ start:2696 stop:3019 length:324 start_codon:yes stop_codon:yes gene_type:complete